MPENFFIIDTYTFEAGKQLFSTRYRCTTKFYNALIGNQERLVFYNELSHALENISECKTAPSIVDDYKDHVKRSYVLGVILKKIEKLYSISKSSNVTYPRLTDIVFQNIL